MNDNLEILTAILVANLVGILTIVFTTSSDAGLVSWLVSFGLTFLATQIQVKEEK